MTKKSDAMECLTSSDRLGLSNELELNNFFEQSVYVKNSFEKSIYSFNDFSTLQSFVPHENNYLLFFETLDDLLERDKQRKRDGFPEKIRVGRMLKPGDSGQKDSIIVVPTTTEEKFYHTDASPDNIGGSSGQGDGDEGDIIGEQSMDEEGEDGQPGDGGENGGGDHGISKESYEVGRMLTEKFKLPNLEDKGKKIAVPRYSYDLIDKNKGSGQILDKKATLKEIVKTNNALGLLSPQDIDSTNLIITPRDKVYNILSREREYESQAIVFFLRDYSGSMSGDPTTAIVTQHIMIYSWLMFQYDERVKTRFILHDTEAKEVPDLNTYYKSNVAGGTKVAPAYKLVNDIIEEENLDRDYNIYVFHGTDGDDWDKGDEALKELRKMIHSVNRAGITVAKNSWSGGNMTMVEKYIRRSGLLKVHRKLLKMDVFPANKSNDKRLAYSIRKLIS